MITRNLSIGDYELAVAEGTAREEWSVANGLKDSRSIAQARAAGTLPLSSLEANIEASKVEIATARYLGVEFIPRHGIYTDESAKIADLQAFGRNIEVKNKINLTKNNYAKPANIGRYYSKRKDNTAQAVVVFGHAFKREVTLFAWVDTVPFWAGKNAFEVTITGDKMRDIESLPVYLGRFAA